MYRVLAPGRLPGPRGGSGIAYPACHCQVPASERLGLEDVPSRGWRVLPYPILISL